MFVLHNSPQRSWWHRLKHVLTGTQYTHKSHQSMQPMAFMLDETKAYKYADNLPQQPTMATCHAPLPQLAGKTPHPNTKAIVDAPVPNKDRSKRHTPAHNVVHMVLQGTPAQICAQLDSLAMQQTNA